MYVDGNFCLTSTNGRFFVIAHGSVISHVADFDAGLELIRYLKAPIRKSSMKPLPKELN